MATETRTAEALRARVVNGLHAPYRDIVTGLDALEAAMRRSKMVIDPNIGATAQRCLQARDAYVNEIVERIESGGEVE